MCNCLAEKNVIDIMMWNVGEVLDRIQEEI